MAKVSTLLRCYADLRKAITHDMSAHDDLGRHSRLRSDAAWGRQP
jgi:hypothetical protein